MDVVTPSETRDGPSLGSGSGEDPKARAIDEALVRYFGLCDGRIGTFITRHYTWCGAWKLYRHASSNDWLKAPFNVLIALPAVAVRLSIAVLSVVGAASLAHRLSRIPLGFETSVERAVRDLVARELLELSPSTTQSLAIECALLAHPAIASLPLALLTEFGSALERAKFGETSRTAIRRYAAARSAAADLTCALLAGVAGIIAFREFTPGAISSGKALGAAVSREAAIEDFVLGRTVGGWFYSAFPPEPSLWTAVVVTLLVAFVVAVCAAFAGVVADPVQVKLGFHRGRLRRLLRSLERKARGSVHDDFKPKDHYFARLSDLVDVLRGWGIG